MGEDTLGTFFSDGEDMESENLNQDAQPLLFMFDIETTGLSIYDDAITDIAGKVFTVLSVNQHLRRWL